MHCSLLSGGADCTIALFDLEAQPAPGNRPALLPIYRIPSAHEYAVSTLAWYPHDNGLFFSGSSDHTVKVWDPNTMRVIRSWTLEGRVFSISLSTGTVNHSLIAGNLNPICASLDMHLLQLAPRIRRAGCVTYAQETHLILLLVAPIPMLPPKEPLQAIVKPFVPLVGFLPPITCWQQVRTL